MIKKGAVLILCAILILHLTACRSDPGPLSSQKAVDIMSPSQTVYDWPETPQEVYTLTVAVAIAKGTPSGQALLAIKEELEQRTATVRAAIIARIFTFSLHDRQQGILYGHLLRIGCIVYNNLLYLFL